jgi:hypothetical protein
MDTLRALCRMTLKHLRKVILLGNPVQLALRRGPTPTPESRTRFDPAVQQHLDALQQLRPELRAAYARAKAFVAPLPVPVSACKVSAANAYAAVRAVLNKALRMFTRYGSNVDLAFQVATEIGIDLSGLDSLKTYLDQQKQHDAQCATPEQSNQSRGGRPAKWTLLRQMIRTCDEDPDRDWPRKQIASEHNKRYAKKIAEGECGKATARKVTEIRCDDKRKQKNKKAHRGNVGKPRP